MTQSHALSPDGSHLGERLRQVDTDTPSALRNVRSQLPAGPDDVAATPEILYTLDRRGCLTGWNRSLETLCGLSAADLKGRPIVELFVDDDWPPVREALRKAFDGYGEGEGRLVAKNGARRRYHLSGVSLKDQDLQVIGITGIARDLTAPAERGAVMAWLTTEVERQTQLLDAVLSASPDHIYMFDRGGRICYVNQAAAAAFGRSIAEIVGKTSREIGLPAVITDAGMTLRKSVFANGSPVTGETRWRTVNGWRDFMYTLSPVPGADGCVDAVVVTASDITERKRTEDRAELLREITEHISSSTDIMEAFAQVLPRTAAALDCRGALVFQIDPDGGRARMVAAHGINEVLTPFIRALSFPPNEPFDGRLQNGETIVLNDMREQRWLPAGIYERFGLRALMAVPLRIRGLGLGALVTFHTKRGARFDDAHVEICRGIARQLAAAMESACLQERLQDEAEVSTALAHVGRELIGPVGSRELLHRLCELTTAEVRCDFCHIWLWQETEGAYTMAASHGDSPEHEEWLRSVLMTRERIAPALAHASVSGVANVSVAELRGHPLGQIVEALGITAALLIELRRGEDVTGLYIAGHRGQSDTFSAKQERIARGIAQLGSLGLESAQLLERFENASRLKSDFLATISHELRTPIHIVVGYHEMLLDGEMGELTPEQIKTLKRTAASATELSELITAILDAGRIEADRMRLDLAETDLSRLVREIDTEMRALREERPNVELNWRVEGAARRIVTDRSKLKVVLKNLVGNALKFTNDGSVDIRLVAESEAIEVSVIDTGIGIPQAQLQTIFEAFRQVDGSTTRRFNGVGLGLYIARHFAQMLGGRISVESEEHRGSTFRLRLPLENRSRAISGPGPKPIAAVAA